MDYVVLLRSKEIGSCERVVGVAVERVIMAEEEASWTLVKPDPEA